MVPSSVIAGQSVSLAIALFTPLAIFLLWRRRTTMLARNAAVGAAVFVLFALVLEPVLHVFLLKANPASAAFFRVHHLAFAVYGSLAAGLFEETGRYLGLRYAVRPAGNPGTALAYGIGHGGAESIIIGGLAIAQGIAFALLLNAGKLDSTLSALHLPSATATRLREGLLNLTPGLSLVAGFERLIALTAQIGLSFLVWNAVETKRTWLVGVAILLHMFTDFGAALLQAGLLKSVALAEGWAFLGLAVIVAVARQLDKPKQQGTA